MHKKKHFFKYNIVKVKVLSQKSTQVTVKVCCIVCLSTPRTLGHKNSDVVHAVQCRTVQTRTLGRQNNLSINEWQETGRQTPQVKTLLSTYIWTRKDVPPRTTMWTFCPEKTDGLREVSKNPSTLNWNNHPWREVTNGTTYHPPSVQSWAPLPDSLTPIHTWTDLAPTSHVSADWDTPSKASWMMVETFSRNWNKSSCLWYSTWRRAFIIFIGCLWLSRGLPWQLGFLFVLFSSLSVFPLLLSPYPAASLWFCVRGRGRRFLLQRERRTCLPSTHQPLTAPPWSLPLLGCQIVPSHMVNIQMFSSNFLSEFNLYVASVFFFFCYSPFGYWTAAQSCVSSPASLGLPPNVSGWKHTLCRLLATPSYLPALLIHSFSIVQ